MKIITTLSAVLIFALAFFYWQASAAKSKQEATRAASMAEVASIAHAAQARAAQEAQEQAAQARAGQAAQERAAQAQAAAKVDLSITENISGLEQAGAEFRAIRADLQAGGQK